ncbi:MAG TPA: hypothetical protein VKT77_18280 [Chthonomonadaceae bacterium]|nr:hypothetical protein [Chthonomonadaceae bacterium]
MKQRVFVFATLSIALGCSAAQAAPIAGSTTTQRLPASTSAAMARYRFRVGEARRRYEAAVKAERVRVERALRRDLLAATKRHDFAGARSILAALGDLPAGDAAKSAGPAAANDSAQIKDALLGKWTVRCGPSFQTIWTFQRDGTVLSANGVPRGQWTWERENRRILIRWDQTAWDSLNLPLNEKGTFGDTYHRQGWRVEAVKLL